MLLTRSDLACGSGGRFYFRVGVPSQHPWLPSVSWAQQVPILASACARGCLVAYEVVLVQDDAALFSYLDHRSTNGVPRQRLDCSQITTPIILLTAPTPTDEELVPCSAAVCAYIVRENLRHVAYR